MAAASASRNASGRVSHEQHAEVDLLAELHFKRIGNGRWKEIVNDHDGIAGFVAAESVIRFPVHPVDAPFQVANGRVRTVRTGKNEGRVIDAVPAAKFSRRRLRSGKIGAGVVAAKHLVGACIGDGAEIAHRHGSRRYTAGSVVEIPEIEQRVAG